MSTIYFLRLSARVYTTSNLDTTLRTTEINRISLPDSLAPHGLYAILTPASRDRLHSSYPNPAFTFIRAVLAEHTPRP